MVAGMQRKVEPSRAWRLQIHPPSSGSNEQYPHCSEIAEAGLGKIVKKSVRVKNEKDLVRQG